MILYNYFRSSASYRVRIALHLKGLAFEYRAVHLLNNGGEQHAESYRDLNPSREVPTLIHNGRALSQSVAIIDYLDSVKAAPRLFPEDPYQRARVLQACEIINSGAQPLHNLRVLQELEKMFEATSEQKNQWTAHWVEYALKAYDSLLKINSEALGRETEFSFSDQPTAAECFLIPHLANADRFHVSLAPYPRLQKIRAACNQLEAFRKAAPNAQPDWPGPTT